MFTLKWYHSFRCFHIVLWDSNSNWRKLLVFGAHFSCQTHEGGIAGEPGSEAHGGYVSSFLCLVGNQLVMTIVLVLSLGCLNHFKPIPWQTLRYGIYRYTYCGLATMILINEVDRLDVAALVVRCASLWYYAESYLWFVVCIRINFAALSAISFLNFNFFITVMF